MISSFIVMLLFAVENAFRSFYSVTFAEDPPFKFSEHYNKLLPVFGLDVKVCQSSRGVYN